MTKLDEIWENTIITNKGEWTIGKYDFDTLKKQYGVKNLKPNKNNIYFMVWYLDYNIGCWAFSSKQIFNTYKKALNCINEEIKLNKKGLNHTYKGK